MNKITSRLLICLFLLTTIFTNPGSGFATTGTSLDISVKGVWVSYFELRRLMTDADEAQFTAAWTELVENSKTSGMNTLYVQIRPFGDALYPSKVYPWSHLASGEEGISPGYDPLKVMIQIAHKNQMKIEAWVNPFRVRINSIKAPIAKDNLALKWLKDGSGRVVQLESGMFYNPSHPEVRALVLKGIQEILQNYSIDGIHLDDYFYPTTAATLDEKLYKAYKDKKGRLSLADWRRSNVDQLVKSIYQAVKKKGVKVQFGISPQGVMKNNYERQYIDVKKWVAQKGYIDYICPQIYFGFENSKQPYEKLLDDWKVLMKNSPVKLYVGIAGYKIGLEDPYAGTGKQEWLMNEYILERMVKAAINKGYQGAVFFRYDSLWLPEEKVAQQVNTEMDALKRLLYR